MNCNTTHYRANSSSVPGDPTALKLEERRDELQETGVSNLSITTEEIVFGGLLKKWRAPLAELEETAAEENVLTIKLRGQPAVLFELSPVDLTAQLEHGNRSVGLTALNLAVRLSKLRIPVQA